MKIWKMAGPLGLALLLAPASALLSTASAPTLINAPRLAAKPGVGSSTAYGWASSNWSGYAITGSTYQSITGSWVVPTVSTLHGAEYSSAWIGIDGFNNSSLIQTGTEQNASHKGTSYNAWWEILPASETPISTMSIQPGDHMAASIVNNGNGTWTISLVDQTTGQHFTTTQAYSGPAQSAEWIMEAPTIGRHVATLAHYGQTTVNPTSVNGQDPQLVTKDGGVMIQRRAQVSTPSAPNPVADGFNIAYGPQAPQPPSS